LEGATTAVEESQAWFVGSTITLDSNGLTRSAVVSGTSAADGHELRLEADGAGLWRIDHSAAPHLNGCRDVDLESSALTNALPARRLGLEIGQTAGAPAAYVRALDLSAERLEQRYVRLNDDRGRERYHYTAPQFDFECELLYDASGLVLEYPGIAVRVA
jgi:uncharacterized protein